MMTANVSNHLRVNRVNLEDSPSRDRNRDIISLEKRKGIWLVRQDEKDRISSKNQVTVDDEYEFYGSNGVSIFKRDDDLHLINEYV